MKDLTKSQIEAFRSVVLGFYKEHGRTALPWRQIDQKETIDPYKVLVSELMLQQTQVSRVIPKYLEFLQLFPSANILARSKLSEVLRAWSGLGYNRRAKFLHQSAQKIMSDFSGSIPRTLEGLIALPGVGRNTAAAILTYSYNIPVVFIETNIRSVFLHHFFPGIEGVSDSDLLPFIESTLDTTAPREWYWALMDYGSYLKSVTPNPSRASKHHTKQSTFLGSNRQIRGAVLKLLKDQNLTKSELSEIIVDKRLNTVLKDLASEQLITEKSGVFSLG